METDLKEVQKMYRSFCGRKVTRTFLTGAKPFVLKYDRLMEIAGLVHRYFPGMGTMGSFARVTDVALKTDEELAADILEQCGRFAPAGEKERLEELQAFFKNLQIRTRLFANSGSNFYPVTAYLPKERDFVVSELQHIMDTVSEEEMAEYRSNLSCPLHGYISTRDIFGMTAICSSAQFRCLRDSRFAFLGEMSFIKMACI